MTFTRPEIVVDVAAIRHNVATIRELVAPAEVMVVVKADGYGHGMVESARAARAGGATWLATATPDEAIALREAGDDGPILCWLALPGYDYRRVRELGITPSAYDVRELAAIGAGDVQLKVDTGLSRGGAPESTWRELFAAAHAAEGVRVTGVWSHFACSDEPDHPANDEQQAAFERALELAGQPGALRHLANSAAALTRPAARFDLVRVGLAAYGLNPAPGVLDTAALGLRPAMTVRAPLAMTKTIPAGAGVSYGHTWIAEQATRVGLVPVGYGDGVPWAASNAAAAQVGGARCPILGRVCMDQFVVQVPDGAEIGDDAVLFGPGDHDEPTAQDWAEACETISYEIVTRIGGRFTRTYVGEGA